MSNMNITSPVIIFLPAMPWSEVAPKKMTMVGTIRKNKPGFPPALLTTKDREFFFQICNYALAVWREINPGWKEGKNYRRTLFLEELGDQEHYEY